MATPPPNLDLGKSHRYFAVQCFDGATFGEQVRQAWSCCQAVAEADDRAVLEKDLNELQAVYGKE
ncbi:MAG TPA: hypothetical protein VHY37_14055 [Tepidisphaeraceae bacterium]|nr:hypothetical protein [Tepidisphaeraceae bacterium]